MFYASAFRIFITLKEGVKMTNEEIAQKLKVSYDCKMALILWENVKKLLYMKSEKIYRSLKERFSALGIELSDIKQECYFVFLNAIKAYRLPYKFVTFLEFPFKQMIDKLLNKNQNPYTENIDELKNSDGYSLCETLCNSDEDIFLLLDKRTDSEIVRAEVEKLSGKQREVIKLFYFEDLSDTEISKLFSNSPVSVGQLRHRALLKLKRSAVLQKLYYLPKYTQPKGGFVRPDYYFMKQIKKQNHFL